MAAPREPTVVRGRLTASATPGKAEVAKDRGPSLITSATPGKAEVAKDRRPLSLTLSPLRGARANGWLMRRGRLPVDGPLSRRSFVVP